MATKPFRPSKTLEQEYLRALRELLQAELSAIGKRSTSADMIASLLRESHARPSYQRFAEALAERMVVNVAIQNARSWRAAATQSQNGRRIYSLLQRELSQGLGDRVQAIVHNNAAQIRTLPLRLAERATFIVAQRQLEGLRASAIAEELRARLPKIAESRLQLIARTEVGKAENAITRSRAEDLGMYWYVWRTSEDQRVRPSHRIMDGVLVQWSDPPSPERLYGERPAPSPYNAGSIYNCRCLSLPLVDTQSVSWPRRIYVHGAIERISRAQFLGQAGQVAA